MSERIEGRMPMEELILFYPEGHQKHAFPGHPERPERVEAILESLKAAGIWAGCQQVAPRILPRAFLETVHTPAYLQQLQQASAASRSLDLDTYTTEASWQLALNAAGGGVAVADAIWRGKAQRGIALTRPPGHHATADRGMGFCLLNNAAIAAEYLSKKQQAENLVILDLDLHHGNGTQDIFYQRPDIGYLSVHQAPFYPGTGKIEEQGLGEGKGSTLNIPLPAGAGDAAYLAITGEIILPFLDQRKPEMVLISYGFDIHWRDPLGGMLVTADGYYRILQQISTWADQHCQGRVAIFLEGGYDLEAAGGCTLGVLRGMLGQEFTDPLGPSGRAETSGWQSVLRQVRSQVE